MPEHLLDLLPHGVCLASSQKLIAIMLVANALIALSYFVIPFILLYLVNSLRNYAVIPSLLAGFSVFIFGCGMTHVMDIVVLFTGGGWYWVQAAVLVLTALASLTVSAVTIDIAFNPKGRDKWIS